MLDHTIVADIKESGFYLKGNERLMDNFNQRTQKMNSGCIEKGYTEGVSRPVKRQEFLDGRRWDIFEIFI